MSGNSPRSSEGSGAGRDNDEPSRAEETSGPSKTQANASRAPPSKARTPKRKIDASRSVSSVPAARSTPRIPTRRERGPMPARVMRTSALNRTPEIRENLYTPALTPFNDPQTTPWGDFVTTNTAAEVQRVKSEQLTDKDSISFHFQSPSRTPVIYSSSSYSSLKIPRPTPFLSSSTSVTGGESALAEPTRTRSVVFPRRFSRSHSQPSAAARTPESFSNSVLNPGLGRISFYSNSPISNTPQRGALESNFNVNTNRTFSTFPTSPSRSPRRKLNPHAKSFQPQQLTAASAHASSSAPASFTAQLVTPTKSISRISSTLVIASPLARPGDTPEQRHKISEVMSAFREIGGDYDSIEWLHTEAPDSQRESPETLTIPPRQAGLYTSVGSLAPPVNQQFTAPNRIQRDGTGRRAPQYNSQGRAHDGHFGVRNMTQHHGRNQFGAGADKNASQANLPTASTSGPSAPAMYSGNVPLNRRDVVRRRDASLNPLAEAFNMGVPGESYRFPPPGLTRPGQANLTEPSFGSFEPIAARQQLQLRGGRPQPLTAGPPGQRQSATGLPPSNRTVASSASNAPVLPAYSPWIPNYRGNTSSGAITDTLPLEEVRQYYPNGFPKDMTGRYQRRRETIGETRPGLTEEVRTAEVNQWFHAGVRRFNKTANDHLADLEHRNYNQDHGLPPPAPFGVIGSGLPKPLSVNEVVEMPLPEASAMMLGPVFGTILSAADQRPGPNNVRALNKYTPSPAWAIDSTPQGNQSFFGEDWGRAPRRVGRDPRYQSQE